MTYRTIAQINEGAVIELHDVCDAQYVLDHPREYAADVRKRAELLIATDPERQARQDRRNHPPRHPRRLAAERFLTELEAAA